MHSAVTASCYTELSDEGRLDHRQEEKELWQHGVQILVKTILP